jgi:hypothetical protein
MAFQSRQPINSPRCTIKVANGSHFSLKLVPVVGLEPTRLFMVPGF